MTLKFESLANIGEMIRAYDFKPMADRGDCYIEGIVTAKGMTDQGFAAYTIRLTRRIFAGEPVAVSIIGEPEISLVPFQVYFCEYDTRITKLEA